MGIWIISVAVAAMLLSLSETLVVQRSLKSVLRLCGGIVMALVLLSPVQQLLGEEDLLGAGELPLLTEVRQEELQALYESSLSQGIQGELSAYLWNKAQEMGLDLTISVATRMGSGGTVVPDRVSIVGSYSEAYSQWLEEELGLDQSHQNWQEA